MCGLKVVGYVLSRKKKNVPNNLSQDDLVRLPIKGMSPSYRKKTMQGDLSSKEHGLKTDFINTKGTVIQKK